MTYAERPGAIVMAVYRPRFDLLERQIESIRSQSVVNWTCVVGIDGRDHATVTAIRDLVDADPRFVVREEDENVGFYRNFERVLAMVPEEAAWIALSDQDDFWFPTKLETLLPSLDHASLAMGQAAVVDVQGRRVGQDTSRRDVSLFAEFIDNQVTGSVSVFRAELLDVAMPFPAPTDLAFHDHWLGVCAKAGAGLAVVDAVVQNYVQHDSNVIGEERASGLAARLTALRGKSGGGLPAALRYLREHRWGWRVSMARTLMKRLGATGAPSAVRMIARGRFTVRSTAMLVRAIASRQAPVGRALALFVGGLVPGRVTPSE